MYCIISVTLSSLAWATCMRVAKHSGVFVIGIRLAGSSVRFFKVCNAANFSSSSLELRIRLQTAVNRLSVDAISWRHGLSCDRFCSAKQAYFRLSSFWEYVAKTTAGTMFFFLKTMILELLRFRDRCAKIFKAYSCEQLSWSLVIATRVSTKYECLARSNAISFSLTKLPRRAKTFWREPCRNSFGSSSYRADASAGSSEGFASISSFFSSSSGDSTLSTASLLLPWLHVDWSSESFESDTLSFGSITPVTASTRPGICAMSVLLSLLLLRSAKRSQQPLLASPSSWLMTRITEAINFGQ
mmetsp:Transcript_23602/g.41472  ORF Transcript_23602/g.41472 Transcript_23602/m.41472 type:complete len:300 (-) Transcript_23602:1543-2442(-)